MVYPPNDMVNAVCDIQTIFPVDREAERPIESHVCGVPTTGVVTRIASTGHSVDCAIGRDLPDTVIFSIRDIEVSLSIDVDVIRTVQ